MYELPFHFQLPTFQPNPKPQTLEPTNPRTQNCEIRPTNFKKVGGGKPPPILRIISRILLPTGVSGHHLSSPAVTHRVKQPTHRLRTSRPFSEQVGNAGICGLSAPGVYLASDVTTGTGGLLHHHFTHHLLRGWYTFCCTCRYR